MNTANSMAEALQKARETFAGIDATARLLQDQCIPTPPGQAAPKTRSPSSINTRQTRWHAASRYPPDDHRDQAPEGRSHRRSTDIHPHLSRLSQEIIPKEITQGRGSNAWSLCFLSCPAGCREGSEAVPAQTIGSLHPREGFTSRQSRRERSLRQRPHSRRPPRLRGRCPAGFPPSWAWGTQSACSLPRGWPRPPREPRDQRRALR